MAPTPKPTPNSTQNYHTPLRTPQTRHRLCFPTPKNGTVLAPVPTEHPVEVIGRIRDYPDCKERNHNPSLEISSDGQSVKVHTDIGYRDFTIDGVSVSESENLPSFYEKFVKSRVEGVRVGSKCTIMMYGPTGSGKSHTMFGSMKEQGIVYMALRDILSESGDLGEKESESGFKLGVFVRVAVLEIYNEEIYDLLSANLNGNSTGLKNTGQKARIEIIGKRAKNPTYLSGNEAGKISREVAKVEKRRVVKSTLCNDRSSRSHCVIILDVPSVGGRLMLVDMAGSENIEAAGQTGFEAKIQTAKINQGNIALKRVVESIANGDSHVPFRDSKLTMLLQDSFEDNKSKILMILCASPDPKDMHKTISTLEYGAKAKCIVRAAHMATPKPSHQIPDDSSLLNSRIQLMNQYIVDLQRAHKEEIVKKDAELAVVRGQKEGLEREVLSQREEIEILKRKLMEIEDNRNNNEGNLGIWGRFADVAGQDMVKSMELDYGDVASSFEVKEVKEDLRNNNNVAVPIWTRNLLPAIEEEASEESSVVTAGADVAVLEDKEVVEEKLDLDLDLDLVIPCSEKDRQKRIENIHRLCGNYREKENRNNGENNNKYGDENAEPGFKKEAKNESGVKQEKEELVDVYVKWEVSKGNSGNLIAKIRVLRDSSLSDLRKVVDAHVDESDSFTFLLLKDPSGAPVQKEKEGEIRVANLPICSNQVNGFLASLRPVKMIKRSANQVPFSSLENKLSSPLAGFAN
ncbi:hypothetical protein LUZ60_006855 [Juncus effusus]|nr:hypothetical protein LUZ60_006855 [Juncus effusus]